MKINTEKIKKSLSFLLALWLADHVFNATLNWIVSYLFNRLF